MARGEHSEHHPNRKVGRPRFELEMYSDRILGQEKLLMNYAQANPEKNPFTKYIIQNDGAANALTDHYYRQQMGLPAGTGEHVPYIESTLQDALKGIVHSSRPLPSSWKTK